jgi:hypothetical protein
LTSSISSWPTSPIQTSPSAGSNEKLDAPVRAAGIHVGRQQLAEPVLGVLGALLGIERAAAVAEADVQPPVGAEGELAAVVVLLGLGDVQQLAHRLGVDRAAAHAELGHARVAALVAPVQVQPAAGREVGVERDPEQALLGAGGDALAEVEQDGPPPAGKAYHATGLLEDPQRARVAGRRADERGTVEAGGDALDRERARAAALGGGRDRIDLVARIAARPHGDGRGGEQQSEPGGGGDQAEAHRPRHLRRP